MKTENSNNDKAADAIAELIELYTGLSKQIVAAAARKGRPLWVEEIKMVKDLAAAIRQLERGAKPEDKPHEIIIGPKDRDF